MTSKPSPQQLSAKLSSLTERRGQVERRIEDCERYLEIAASFTSSEEQLRTASDIQEYQEELEILSAKIAVLTNHLSA